MRLVHPTRDDERIDTYVREVVAQFPPLTTEQCEKVATILRSAPVDEQDAAA